MTNANLTNASLANEKVNPGLGYFPAVDGLRALAVLTVMAFHLDQDLLSCGYVGVDIFFVISGFVVTASIAHMRFATLPDLLSYFYARRVARILPALLACLVVTSIFYCLFVPSAWLSRAIPDTAKWAFLGASNIALSNGGDYFSPAAAFNPFTHTWSLGVEEQFYLVFPFLMFFGQGGSGKHARWLVPLILALCLLSLITSAVLTPGNWSHAFYLLPSRYWELGLGMALCLTMDRWRPLLESHARATLALTIAGVAAIACAVVMPADVSFPFPGALAPALGAVALIASAVARPEGSLMSPLRWGPIVFIGQISYALYLWHWPIDSMMRWTVGLSTWTAYAIATLGAFALAIPTYYFIEQPARRWRATSGLRPSVIATIGVAAAVGLGFITTKLVQNHKDVVSLSVTRDVATWHPTSIAPPRSACDVIDRTHSEGAASVRTFTPAKCAAPNAPGILVVAGDSHAIAYTRMLASYARESGREVRLYTIPGCRIVSLLPEQPDTACARNQLAIVKALGARTGPRDVIFLPSLRTPRYGDQSGMSAEEASAWERESRKWSADGNAALLLDAMMSGGAQVVFEGPTPVFKAPPFRCADWFNRTNPDCIGSLSIAQTELRARHAPALATMRRLARQDDRVSVWDPFPVLCPGAQCEAFESGKPLFFDGDHLSAYSNDLLLPSFSAAMATKFVPAPGDELTGDTSAEAR